MLKTIHLFRHGQTDWNLQRKMQGHTDIPLNEEGRKQALALQDFFTKHPVTIMASSDLIRAKQTAAIANQILQAPTTEHAAFREVFLGDIEGMTLEEVTAKHGDESWQRWTSNDAINFDFTYKNGESAKLAVARFTQGLIDFCESQDFSEAGLCTHGFMLKHFLLSLRSDVTHLFPIPNCAVFTVEWDKNSGFKFNP